MAKRNFSKPTKGRPRGRPRKTEKCSSLPKKSLTKYNLLDKNQAIRTVKMGDSTDLPKEWGRSCYVHLKRLTEEQIAKYTSAGGATTTQDYLGPLQHIITTKHSLRDVPHIKSEMFDSYKKSRERFLNRRSHQSSTEMTNFGAFSGDEFSEPSEEEYHTGSRAHKRKRLAYEDDLEWSPTTDGKYHPVEKRLVEKRLVAKPRKIGLRVNTRRKRIESNSSCSSDEDSFYYPAKDKSDSEKPPTLNGDISVNIAPTSVSSLKKKAPDTPNSKKGVSKITRDSSPLIDTDLLSKIMHEMSDYNMKNSKPANKSSGSEGVDKSNVDGSNADISHYPPVKKRKSHLFRITDEDVTPRLTSIQQIVRKMVNQVCSGERRRLLAASGVSRRKICKWCDVPISPVTGSNNNVDNDLCTKCRNVSKDSKISNSSLNKIKVGGTSTKPKSGNKIKSKLYKNLPKYDQQRLAYSGQADKSSVSKGYNHCKSFVTPKDVESSEVTEKTVVIKSSEKVKLKKKKDSLKMKTKDSINIQAKDSIKIQSKDSLKVKSKDMLKKKAKDSVDVSSKFKVKKKKKKIISDSKPKIKTLVSSGINYTVGEKKLKQVSVTNVEKGLFLMTFPEPHQELEIPPNEIKPVSVNKIDEKSEVIIKNLSDLSRNKLKQSVTNNVQYGNYLLPPVPTVVVANYAATDAKSGDYYLSSVYYQNEMTRSKNTPLKSDGVFTVKNEGIMSVKNENMMTLKNDGIMTIKKDGIMTLKNDSIMTLKNDGILTVTTSGSLPSMPTIAQMSPSAALSFPQAYHQNSLPLLDFGISDISNSMLFQSHMISPANISISTYPPQDNADIFNNASVSYQDPLESDFSSLLNNPELQIQSLQPKDSDSTFNLFDNQDLNLGDSFEDNSNLTIENCNEDFDVLMKDSVNENIQDINFDNNSLNSGTLKKHTNDNGSLDTDTSKVPEQNTDNQSSSAAGNSSVENLFYLSETQNLSSEAWLEYCSAELDALCILAIVDLERKPKGALSQRITSNKSQIETLKNAETEDEVSLTRLKYLEGEGRTLDIASLLLNTFGSFTKLSDSMLRKQRLLQIKKEKCLELEETRSSCQFAKSALPLPIQSQNELSNQPIENMSSAVRLKMENAQSCSFAPRLSEPVNHIEKIQTQIQSIQGNSSATVDPGQLGLIHHFPAPDMPVASNVTLSIAPRTEMMSEFRETPSRGSGPRTPARPESAMSQNDEGILTPQQIKRERLEATSSPLSQCAFSQNTTTSPRIPTSTPNIPQITPVHSLALVPVNSPLINALSNQRHHSVAPAVSINNSNSQIQKVMQHAVAPAASINSNLQIQKVMQMHQGQFVPPNVTVPFSPGNQNFTKVVVNKPTPPSNAVANLNHHPSSANVIVRGNYMNIQPVNVPGTTGGQLFQRYVQSSVPAISSNMNSYSYKQTMNSGGTMLVNSIGQNYALANTQVPNQQQVPRVYNTGNVQQAVQVPNSGNQAPPNTAYLMPNSKREEPTPMTCAVCNKPATLRCKQCAKVAYCNTVCAKTYWHEKHKMECKMMLGNI